MKRAISRSLASLGMGAIVATCIYPPWAYGIAAVPRPAVDVAVCIKERKYAPLWSPPSNSIVSHEQAQTVMCSGPDIDVWILAGNGWRARSKSKPFLAHGSATDVAHAAGSDTT